MVCVKTQPSQIKYVICQPAEFPCIYDIDDINVIDYIHDIHDINAIHNIHAIYNIYDIYDIHDSSKSRGTKVECLINDLVTSIHHYLG